MDTITEGKVIAFAINALSSRGFDRRLKDIFVEPQRRLFHFAGTGWMVVFVFEEEDNFLHKTLTIEVSGNGDSAVFESL